MSHPNTALVCRGPEGESRSELVSLYPETDGQRTPLGTLRRAELESFS